MSTNGSDTSEALGTPESPRPRVSASPCLRLVLRLLLSVGVLGWLVWRIEWPPILEAFGRVHLGLCAASLLTYCGAQVISSVRWRLLARSLGFREKLRRFISLYYVGMFFNLFLPTSMGGDVVRAWYLGAPSAARANTAARSLALLSVISERFSGLLALLLVASLAALANPAGLPNWSLWLVWGLSAGGVLGVLSLPVLSHRLPKLRSLAQGLSLYRGHRRLWLAGFGLSIVVQLAGIVEVWLLGLALEVPASFAVLAVAAPLVVLFTMLPITLNGVGVREGGLVLLLAPAGVAPAEALALGVLWFCVLATASLIGGIVYLFGGEIRNSKPEIRNNIEARMTKYPDPLRRAS